MTSIAWAVALASTLIASTPGGQEKKLLAVFILDGSGPAAKTVDPDGKLRRAVEKDVGAEFPSGRARMKSKDEVQQAIQLHPTEFERANSAREGARVLGVPLLFSIQMEPGLLRKRAIVAFGETDAPAPAVQCKLAGSSVEEMLADWEKKKKRFFTTVQKAVARITSGSAVQPPAGDMSKPPRSKSPESAQ